MSWTRRRSALALFALSGAAMVSVPGFARERPQRHNDDDDEGSDTIPNLFISPCGEPFRAANGAPYPVVDWFHHANKKGDGKLDHDEFVADADAFFKRLDLNGDGALSRYEVLIYERKLVPEIMGGPVTVVGENGGARLWLAQYGGGQGPMGGVNQPIDPAGDHPDETAPPHPKGLDESGQGASPYSFFQEPEPIMTADFNVNGIVLRDNFLKVADMHFTALDRDEKGYLSLAALPETAVEKLLHKGHRGRRGA